MAEYDKGFRDGYLEGLSECGPLSGFTKWFERRAKTQKIGKMKAAERQAIVQRAIAEYESGARGAKQRLLKNPSKQVHRAEYKNALDSFNLRMSLARNKEMPAKSRLQLASMAVFWSGIAMAHSATAKERDKAEAAMDRASTLVQKIAATRSKNPSKAGSAALGGVAGGLLLGPVGAAAGAYGGVKLKQRAEGKKAARSRARGKSAKRKRNPTVGRLMTKALK